MKRNSAAAVVVAIFLLARGSGEAQVCSPQPFGVDPVYGNFTPTTWIEGSLSWVNNAMGARFSGVWANTDFDVWFVGEARGGRPIAAHFDGFSIQASQFPGTEWQWLNSVWGSASNDVWAVGVTYGQYGADGLIEHWDGTQWTTTVLSVPTGALYKVAGTASDDVWAAGGLAILHWDGTSWTDSPGFVPDQHCMFCGSFGLAAISRDDALVATGDGCQRWDGTSWHTTPCGVQGGSGIFAPNSNDIWVIGQFWHGSSVRAHWDGTSWSTVVAGYRYGSIGGTGPADIWIDGTLHYDGRYWTETNCGPRFGALSVSNNGAFIGVNDLGIEYFSGNDWPFLARTKVSWIALGGREPAGIFAVGEKGTVIHYDGARWSGQDFALPREDEYLVSAFGSSPSDIWGTTFISGLLRHFDGKGWAVVDTPGAPFVTGFARAPNDAIAVGRDSRAWHWDGSSWWEITLPIFGGDSISEFWGTARDDVWAVGCCSGGIYHWDGDSWQRVYTAAEPDVTHVGGSARDDVWFTLRLRYQTTIVLHWDGKSFTEVASFPFQGPVWGITSTNPSDVWLALSGEVGHYDGVSWTVGPPAANRVLAVRGAGAFFINYLGHIYQNR